FAAALRTGSDLTVDQATARALGRTSTLPPTTPDATHTPADVARAIQQEHDPLTRRECEVVNLLAEGLTDKQISSPLTTSPRTAEGHVQRILNKLGFTSRTQAATWAVGYRPAARDTASGASRDGRYPTA